MSDICSHKPNKHLIYMGLTFAAISTSKFCASFIYCNSSKMLKYGQILVNLIDTFLLSGCQSCCGAQTVFSQERRPWSFQNSTNVLLIQVLKAWQNENIHTYILIIRNWFLSQWFQCTIIFLYRGLFHSKRSGESNSDPRAAVQESNHCGTGQEGCSGSFGYKVL